MSAATDALTWRFVTFDALTTAELYELLQLRSEVFVVEQACIFQDMDGADVQAMHLLGTDGGRLVAYARCFAAGVKFTEASMGRVITRGSLRSGGVGHALVQQTRLPLAPMGRAAHPDWCAGATGTVLCAAWFRKNRKAIY